MAEETNPSLEPTAGSSAATREHEDENLTWKRPPMPEGLEHLKWDHSDITEDPYDDKSGYVAGTIARNMANVCRISLQKPIKNELYVRQAYIDLNTAVIKSFKELSKFDPAVDKKPNICLMQVDGTPQIGKSSFMCYLLPSFVQETQMERIVIIHVSCVDSKESKREGVMHFYTVLDFNPEYFPSNRQAGPNSNPITPDGASPNKKCKCLYGVSSTSLLREEIPTEYITQSKTEHRKWVTFLDGMKGIPPYLSAMGHVIAFCSPGFTALTGAQNYFLGLKYVMPNWEWPELQDFYNTKRSYFPPNADIKTYYYQFGGCIGYMLGTQAYINDMRQDLFVDAVEKLIDRYPTLTRTINEEFRGELCARLYKLVPNDGYVEYNGLLTNYMSQALRRWIAYERSMTVKRKTAREVEARQDVGDTEASTFDGLVFESIFMYVWLYEDRRVNLLVWESYHDDGHRALDDEVGLPYEIDLLAAPEEVKHKSHRFPLRFNTMYRMSKNAPSVDFYIIEPITLETAVTKHTEDTFIKADKVNGKRMHKNICSLPDTTQGFRLYLIQTTQASRHPANFQAILQYLGYMDNTIDRNIDDRQVLLDAAKNGASEKLKRKAAGLRKSKAWLEENEGQDLTTFLTMENVEIWYMYVQEELDADFEGARIPKDFVVEQIEEYPGKGKGREKSSTPAGATKTVGKGQDKSATKGTNKPAAKTAPKSAGKPAPKSGAKNKTPSPKKTAAPPATTEAKASTSRVSLHRACKAAKQDEETHDSSEDESEEEVEEEKLTIRNRGDNHAAKVIIKNKLRVVYAHVDKTVPNQEKTIGADDDGDAPSGQHGPPAQDDQATQSVQLAASQ